MPATAAPFFEVLEANRPDLNGIRFSIFGLGDRVFAETFNQGSEKLMKELLACNATLIGGARPARCLNRRHARRYCDPLDQGMYGRAYAADQLTNAGSRDAGSLA